MLEIKDVSFSRDNKNILKHVNLDIDSNKFIAITGPNGSGKSTLANMIMGIEKPDSGKIIFNGTDITNMTIDERARMGIGFAFQQPVKFKGITVYAANKIFPGIEFLAKFVLERGDNAYKKINISGYGKEINVHLSKLSHLWSVDVNVIGEEKKRSESMNNENSIKSDNKCKQIIIYNKDTKEQHTGILLNDGNVICGCCGNLIEGNLIGNGEDKEYQIITIYDEWVNMDDLIGE